MLDVFQNLKKLQKIISFFAHQARPKDEIHFGLAPSYGEMGVFDLRVL